MMLDTVLYIHILAATVWIGGSIFLFTLGIFLRDKEAQKSVYFYIGPLYGYMESVWLAILIVTGLWMFFHLDLNVILSLNTPKDIASILTIKLWLVGAITLLTIIHMYIAFKTHNQERTRLQKFLSRGSSMGIFLLNLIIIWYALHLRNYL